MLAARASRDWGMLDVLLTVEDLPPGWHMSREERFRLGFVHNAERDRRARQAGLVGAAREFVHDETRSRVIAHGSPTVDDDDARSRVAAAWRGSLEEDSPSATRTQTEVTPPTAAGEHARCVLMTAGMPAAWRTLSVVWTDGPIFLGVTYRAPAEVELWELTSVLIERQRKRIANHAVRSDD
jgi:hypothetical protein